MDPRVAGNCETTAEIVPKRQAKLGACFAKSEEGITTVAAEIATGPRTDLSPCDQAADVVFGAVVVKRDLRPLQHQQ